MPLRSGKSKRIVSSNIKEMISSWKRKGTIGKASPETKTKARKMAIAIALEKAGKGR